MKTNIKLIIVIVALGLVALVLYAMQVGRRNDANTLVTERGYMLKSSLSQSDTWTLEYDSSGKPETIGLVFTSKSLCVADGTVQTCKPNQYQNGQGVQVEGYVVGKQFQVTSMQILDEIKDIENEEEVESADEAQL